MLLLLAEFYATPWALDPTIHAQMEMILERWAAGTRLTQDQIQAAVGTAPQAIAQRRQQAAQASGGAVAVVPVYGVLTHRAYAAQSVSTTLTSTEGLSAQIQAAENNPEVSSIVLDVNSPGGSVFGVQEVGDTIYRARSTKPVIAVVNSIAASGGYWVASQATEVVITPSGMAGSIGAFMAHEDRSQKYAQEGIKRTYVHAGKYKVEGNDSGPLEGEALAYTQSMVDAFYSSFVRAVSRGRGVSVDIARGPDFGQGRMVMAKEAVTRGMANRIGTLEQVIAEQSKASPRRTSGNLSASTASARLQILQAG